jgi:hypothetical protein
MYLASALAPRIEKKNSASGTGANQLAAVYFKPFLL